MPKSKHHRVGVGLLLPLCVALTGLVGEDDDDGESRRRSRERDGGLLGRLITAGARPLRDREFADHDPAKVALGRALFYDKELSGNRDVSCATCHHPLTHTGDGLSLPAGVGGAGLSVTRVMGVGRMRVPRNAPEIWNREAFPTMFWDSRVAEDFREPHGFRSPAGDELPPGLDSVLAVQAMFPVTSAAEMRGNPGENEIGSASSLEEVWERLMNRLLALQGYRVLFAAAYPEIPLRRLGFQHAANAIAAYEASAWKATEAPFNRYLKGDMEALSGGERRGAALFFGRAGCNRCHSGPLLSDLRHHAIAMPQIGPGTGDGPDGDEDFGRERETGRLADRYAFRTPSLWNTAVNGPWGHDGAYATLEAVVLHHLDPVASLESYDATQARLPASPNAEDPYSVMRDRKKRRAIAAANDLRRVRLSRHEFRDLMAFLNALTDPHSLDARAEVPRSVPSGLPIAD